MRHTYFFHFLKHRFKDVGSEKFCFTARLRFKRHFFLIYFALKSKLGLKSLIKKEKNVIWGEG
jgi:hypothetical protein